MAGKGKILAFIISYSATVTSDFTHLVALGFGADSKSAPQGGIGSSSVVSKRT
jgi:hypothetical protein